MANETVSHAEAKSICDKLEISPSATDASGNYGGKPNVVPTAKNSMAAAGGQQTKEFQMSDRGSKLPNYKSQFAKTAGPA